VHILKILLVGTVVTLFYLGTITLPEVHAVNSISWGANPYPIDAGKVGQAPVTFQVVDDALAANPATNTINVRITSIDDPTGITLTLTETTATSGTFQGTVIFTENTAIFQVGDTVIIKIKDICDDGMGGGPKTGTHGNCDGAVRNTLIGGANPTGYDPADPLNSFDGAYAQSQSDPASNVAIHFEETGPDTDIFEGRLQLVSSSSISESFPNISKLEVASGNTITVFDSVLDEGANGFVGGVTNKGAIRVGNQENLPTTVTLHYTFVGSAFDTPVDVAVNPSSSPGRGGGGLLIPSLVVDAVIPSSTSERGIGNGCLGDCIPPTLGVDEHYTRFVSGGFSYNDHPVDVELFYTPYPLITVSIGEKNKAILKIFDNFDPENISHVGLAFGLGKGQFFDDSKASIEIDIQNMNVTNISTYDPESTLQDIHVKTWRDKCSPLISQYCLVLEIDHTFRAPLEFNMVSTLVWDENHNQWQNYYNHGIEIIGKSLNPPKQYLGIDKGHQILLTEIEKNKATDENGNMWTFDKEWKKDYTSKDRSNEPPTMHGYNRQHPLFSTYKQVQALLAEEKMSEILK
jgi:hypothetical protein